LQFEESAVDLVDDDDRLDTLTKCLSEYSLGLDANAFHAVDNYKRAVGDTKGSCDF